MSNTGQPLHAAGISTSAHHNPGVDELLAGLGTDDFEDLEEDSPLKKPDETDEVGHPFTPPDPPLPAIPAQVSFSTAAGRKLAPPSSRAMKRANDIITAAANDVENEHDELQQQSKRQRRESPQSSGTPGPLPGPSHVAGPTSERSLLQPAAGATFPAPSSFGPAVQSACGFQFGTGASAPACSPGSRAKAMSLSCDSENGSAAALDSTSAPPTRSGFHFASGRDTKQVDPESMARAMAMFEEGPGPAATSPQGPPSASPLPSVSRPIRIGVPSGTLASTLTPTRVPLQSRTNTLNDGEPVTPRPIKLPKGISVVSSTSTPRPRIGLGLSRKAKSGFRSPFKNGTPPLSTPAKTASPQVSTPLKSSRLSVAITPDPKVSQRDAPVFNLELPQERQSMRQLNLYPRVYSPSELASIGIPRELQTLGLETAKNYQFIRNGSFACGSAQAFTQLRTEGCQLASQKWVDNHWSMILWKLAGQVLAKPVLFAEKWNWDQVLNQLKYRYEREYGSSQRPIIRRIQEHDSSPSLPMVLCVSGIHQPAATLNEKGDTVSPRPYLELTDGWYRIRAAVDDSMARAITKGRITVGRKLSLSGAKLDSGTDGADVFAAYNKSHMVLSGNSCHLARWDARLGAQALPFIVGLSSMTVDGGTAVLMDVIVERVYPLAYMKAERNSRDAPWGEEEEERLAQEWKTKYEEGAARVNEEMRKSLASMEDLASTLARQAEDSGPLFGSPPDTICDDLDHLLGLELKDTMAQIASYSNERVAHLAVHARHRLQQMADKERGGLESRLKELCPRREVRDFRMVRIRDARQGRKEQSRTGMLNVWDARALGDELVEGKRYWVSNITPGRAGDWSKPTPGTLKEVYLHTRRDTRWQKVSQTETKV